MRIYSMNPTITVTGAINTNDHTVWVNGVKATLTSNKGTNGTLWNWKAENVPITPGATAVFQIRAIPNSDNGGNGTGGNNGNGATMRNPGNPYSPQEKDL